MSWSDDQIEEIKNLVGEGLSATQVGRHFGVTRNAIIGVCFRRGIVLGGSLGPTRSYTKPPKLAGEPRSHHRPKPAPVARDEPQPIGPIDTFSHTGTCKWIAGDPTQRGWQCCGHNALPGEPWCEFHHAKAFNRDATVNFQSSWGLPRKKVAEAA